MIGSKVSSRVFGRVRRVVGVSASSGRFRRSAVGVVVVLLAAVLVPVGGVGAQEVVGPDVVLGPGGVGSSPVAVAGHGRVTLSWRAPADDGGSPIVGYEYTYSSGVAGSENARGVWYPIPGSSGSTTSYTVTGLRNGTSYVFKLRAVNAAGRKGDVDRAFSTQPVTPTGLPQAPGGLTAEPADSQVTLKWVQQNSSTGQTAATGWADLVRYEYQQKTGDGDWTPWSVVPASDKDSSQFVVKGLTNGVAYRFRLRAVNANGAGPHTEAGPVMASGVPGRPRAVTAVPGDESVTLSWVASSDGGSPIVAWEYRGADENTGITSTTAWTRIPGSGAGTTSYVVTGLDNDEDYRFEVRAVNVNGAGTASAATPVVQPGSPPGSIPAARFKPTAAEDSVTLLWSGPRGADDQLDNGGSPIVRYEYQQKAGDGQWGQWMTIPADRTFLTGSKSAQLAVLDTRNDRTYKITGLTPGTPYLFRVRAVNRISAGPWVETPKPLYPGTVPAAPTNFSLRSVWDARAGFASAVLSWTPGSDGGSPITGWEYKKGNTLEALASSTSWTFLCDSTGGTNYLDTDPTTAQECAALSTVTVPRPPLPGKATSADGAGFFTDRYYILRAVNSYGKGFPSAVARLKVDGKSQPPGAPNYVTVPYYKEALSSGAGPRIGTYAGYDPTASGTPFASKYEFSWKVGDGSWGPWSEQRTLAKYTIGETYQVRARHTNDNGPGPATEGPVFVYGGPPLPGGGSIYGASGGSTGAAVRFLPALRADAGTSMVTLSLRDSAAASAPISTRSQMDHIEGTIRWEYSYKVADNDWGEWTFVNHGEQFNDSQELEIDGLSNGVEHRFRIRAAAGSLPGIALESKPVTPGVAPPAPEGLSAAGGDRQVTLTWTSAGSGGPAITKWQYCNLSTGCDAAGDWTDVTGSNAATTSVVVRSLTNGTAYTFRVRAVNAIGEGAAAQTLPVTPGRVPSVPVRALVEAGDAQVKFRVSKPSQNHGNRVVGYEVRTKRAGEPWEAWEALGTTVAATDDVDDMRPSAETSAVVRNLENGVSYTFQVRAVNSYGSGPHVETSAVVPIGAPTGGTLSARAGDAQVVLSWADARSAGSTITAWQYRQRHGDGGYGTWSDIAGSGPATRSHTVTGLSNGLDYQFAIRAVTANDQNGFESESGTVTPSTTPPQPASVTATRGDRQVTLSWTAGTAGEPGTATWAAPTTSWRYRMRTGDGGFATWTDVADSGAATTGHTVTGLINGVSYTFEVRAVNAMGAGAAASASATPAVVPPAPTLAAEPGDMAVTLSWSSNGDGGSAITGWQVRTGDGAWADLAASEANTVSIPNLDNGTVYIFGVRAVNAVGAGAAVTASATPAGTPPAPAVTAEAGDMMVMLSWASNGDGGSAITGWQVRTGDGEWADLAADATGHVVSGLVNGTAYAFGVRAINLVGDGVVATESATPAAVPAAPTVSVVGGDGEVTLSWVSAGDGGSAITGWHYRMRVGVGDYGEWIVMAADAEGASLTGLDTGTGAVAYVFEVRATNALGDGAVTVSDSVVPTSAPPVGEDYYSGVVDGPDFCAGRSLGGARLFALDGDGDGVADTCSLPYTRREAIARQNAVVTLANRYPDQYRALVNAACAAEPNGDRSCGGDSLAVPGYAPMNDGGLYYSGIITGPGYCANRSLGGPTTYPLDSDGDGVADVCSLPYSRREAVARQKAGDALAAMHLDEFKTALAEECRRLGGTDYGDAPADLASDVCAR